MISTVSLKRLDCGSQHHLIVGCEFHLSTFVEDVLVSTVGEYVPEHKTITYGDSHDTDPRETVGLGRYYETYVFVTDNDWSVKQIGEWEEYEHPDVAEYLEIDSLPSDTAREAIKNHNLMVAKYEGAKGDIEGGDE